MHNLNITTLHSGHSKKTMTIDTYVKKVITDTLSTIYILRDEIQHNKISIYYILRI